MKQLPLTAPLRIHVVRHAHFNTLHNHRDVYSHPCVHFLLVRYLTREAKLAYWRSLLEEYSTRLHGNCRVPSNALPYNEWRKVSELRLQNKK